jgi:hypothetical protein
MSTSARSALNLDVALQPKQWELWRLIDETAKTDIGYFGARGGGKSGGARRVMILRRLKYAGTPGIILRRTYDELYKNHLLPLLDEFPALRPWWNNEHKQLVFPNGSRLYFGYAEHLDDVKRYVGSELGDICPEEAGFFTPEELEILRGSRRWSRDPAFTPKMIYPFMPGGPSHHYLKRIFYDKDYQGEERAENFAAIYAFGWDNVEWARKSLAVDGLTERDYYSWSDIQRKAYFIERTDYGRTLASLKDEQLRAAWLDGSMEITEGLVFPELQAEVHNLDQYVRDEDWQEFCSGLKLLGGLDHASSGVTAYLQEGISADGIKFSLEEYYERNQTIAQHARAMRLLQSRYGDNDYTLIDPSTEAKTLQGKNPQTNQDEMWSVLDEYRRNGITAMPAGRSYVSTGLDLLKGLLWSNPQALHPFTQTLGTPAWFISKKRCPNLWREIKELQRVFNAEGKWEFVGSDHALDCSRYIAMSRPQAPEVPKSAEFNLAHAVGYTSVDSKAARTIARFDKSFGKEPQSNSWMSHL